MGGVKREAWLKFSLLVNMILLGVIFFLAADKRTSRQPARPEVQNDSGNSTASGPEVQNVRPPALFSASWVESLRAAGVGNKILAQVVLADFEDGWQKRLDDTQQKYDLGEVDSDAFDQLALEHETAQEETLRATLGEEGFKQWDTAQTLQSLNLKKLQLTPGETNSLYALQKDLQRRLRELQAAKLKGDIDDAGYAEEQTKAQAACNEQVKALLGDNRYATMQGAGEDPDLQRSLKKLNATDEQLQTLLQTQNGWAESRAALEGQIQTNQPQAAALEQQIQALDAARTQAFQQVLGTNGLDAIQKVQDPRYAALKRYENTWGINDADADYVYGTIQSYEKNMDDYQQAARDMEQNGQPVDWDAVNKNMQQFSQQTQQSLQNYLGADRFNKINRNQIFPFPQSPPTAQP